MNSQLQLSFDSALCADPQPRLASRLRHARWWFERMRQVVDRALDRNPERGGRPEQIYFPLRGAA
jgi:hypothetical protein